MNKDLLNYNVIKFGGDYWILDNYDPIAKDQLLRRYNLCINECTFDLQNLFVRISKPNILFKKLEGLGYKQLL